MANPPGTYLIEFNDGTPSLHTGQGTLLQDHSFRAPAGNDQIFIFAIQDPQIHYSQPPGPEPIAWFNIAVEPIERPADIEPSFSVDRMVLTLHVDPPPDLAFDLVFRFKLFFDNGLSLGPDDGVKPLDPTIIEKPPD